VGADRTAREQVCADPVGRVRSPFSGREHHHVSVVSSRDGIFEFRGWGGR